MGFFIECARLWAVIGFVMSFMQIAYTLAKLTFTDSTIPAVRGWLIECGYSWPAEISSKATLG